MDALTFVEQRPPAEFKPVYVLAGEDRFLKRLAREAVRRWVLGEGEDDFAASTHDGETATLADVRDELATLPFLAARRLVIVQDADSFVTRHREGLEKYVAAPSATGVLVLEVKSWKSNTRLAKAVPDSATVDCTTPKPAQLVPWIRRWAGKQYGKELTAPAAELLVELVGPEMGVLDQELAKLAVYVGDRPRVDQADVDLLVGHSRAETAWQMLDALAEGKQGAALTTLHYLLDQGEDPIGLLGALSWQLRRVAQVARLAQEGVPLGGAMSRAGVQPFAQRRVEQILRVLGPRSLRIYDWLTETDLAMKSTDHLPPGILLERLLIKLAGASGPTAAGVAGRRA
jgi:DNA polymerase-3 subunit delta